MRMPYKKRLRRRRSSRYDLDRVSVEIAYVEVWDDEERQKILEKDLAKRDPSAEQILDFFSHMPQIDPERRKQLAEVRKKILEEDRKKRENEERKAAKRDESKPKRKRANKASDIDEMDVDNLFL
eukprot:TRINITY_DN35751_c0_g1_i1.p1 TRINITY_DN35751_c0_g1~~TRINITY_DN35751_c0_g1_i1.p1  ORF type:complete len:125 (+),score=29.22 TRINITY_DN35751_c0_g1_i1:126-500(+)